MKTKLLAVIMVLIFCGCSTAPVILATKESKAMSEAETRFLYYRPMPFCISEAGDPSGTYPNMDYVTLTDVDGDQGLGEAMAIFWNSESVEFNPVGATVTPFVDSFQHAYISPLPDQTGLTSYASIWGGVQLDDRDSPAVQPPEKVCSGDNSLLDKTVVFYTLTAYDRTFPYGEFCNVYFFIRYVSSEWRLYYQFDFNTGPARALIICNPQYASGLIDPMLYNMDSSGAVTVFGKTIAWEAWYNNTYTVSGVGFTSSSVAFTYPAP